MNAKRMLPLLKIAVFDIGGPLLVYQLLRSSGFSTVSALILSGILPAIGVIITAVQQRHVDAVGILVLDEGSVGTGVFGLLCLGSLFTSRPLMYRFAMQFIGPDSPRGREFAGLWQYREFRHVFRVVTVVWGTAYLLEAAARVIIVQETSAGTG